METRRTIDGKTCGWFVQTVTHNFRRTRVATVGMGVPSADSDTRTANRIDEGFDDSRRRRLESGTALDSSSGMPKTSNPLTEH